MFFIVILMENCIQTTVLESLGPPKKRGGSGLTLFLCTWDLQTTNLFKIPWFVGYCCRVEGINYGWMIPIDKSIVNPYRCVDFYEQIPKTQFLFKDFMILRVISKASIESPTNIHDKSMTRPWWMIPPNCLNSHCRQHRKPECSTMRRGGGGVFCIDGVSGKTPFTKKQWMMSNKKDY